MYLLYTVVIVLGVQQGTDVSMCVYVLCSRALMRFAWWALTVHGALLFRVGLRCGSCGFVFGSVVFMCSIEVLKNLPPIVQMVLLAIVLLLLLRKWGILTRDQQ